MHFDGVLYAGISRNMAHGIGSAWRPVFSPTIFPVFYEHPSFALWIHSLFFRLLGDGYLVERIYTLFFVVINIGLVVYLWCRSFRFAKVQYLAWIPILLWLVANVLISSTFDTNYLEITATIFPLLAFCFLTAESFLFKKSRSISIILAAFCIFLGFLANGPVFLFPLVVPLWQSLINRDFKLRRAMLETILLFLGFSLFLFVLFVCCPQAFINIKNYFLTQVIPSTIGNRVDPGIVGFHRLHILLIVLQATSVLIVLSVLSLFIKDKTQEVAESKELKRKFWFFLAVAISASFPLVLAHRQYPHYVFPSLPFYVLAFSQIITMSIVTILKKANARKKMIKLFVIFSFCVLFASILIFSFKITTPKSHKNLWNDVFTIGKYVGRNQVLSSFGNISKDSIRGKTYFERFFQILIRPGIKAKYYIALKNHTAPSARYVKISLNTKVYDLYKRRK
jgi:hypothetical protein